MLQCCRKGLGFLVHLSHYQIYERRRDVTGEIQNVQSCGILQLPTTPALHGAQTQDVLSDNLVRLFWESFGPWAPNLKAIFRSTRFNCSFTDGISAMTGMTLKRDLKEHFNRKQTLKTCRCNLALISLSLNQPSWIQPFNLFELTIRVTFAVCAWESFQSLGCCHLEK